MSNTSLADLPEAICTLVKERLPDLRECEAKAGKYSLDELKKEGLPAPAVVISNIGAKQDITFSGPAHSYQLEMVAYVVTKDGLGLHRDVAAANICQTLLQLIPGNRWGVTAVGEARDVRMHTLISTKSRSQGVSLWAVTWAQPITFFVPEDAPLGFDLYVSQAPEIGLDHEGDYEQVGRVDL